MAFTGNYVCNSFKTEMALGTHNFTASTGDVFKIAMYTNAATLNASTTAYSATSEVTGTGYTAGGATLTNVTPTLSGATVVIDFADVTFAASTIANARGALIYNSTDGNKAVAVLDFGSDKSTSGTDFVIQMPAPDASNAILRIA